MRWFAIILCLLCSPAWAASLAWDWTQGDGGAAEGFRVYYGSQSGIYTNHVDTGLAQTWQLPNAWPNGTYYFAASAYNQCCDPQPCTPVLCESAYSNEAVWVKSGTRSIRPASGGSYQLTWIEDQLMAAPTYVAEYPTVFNSSTTPKTAMNAVAINSGDVLVYVAACENDDDISATENGSGTLSSLQVVHVVDYTEVEAWSYVPASNENLTATFTCGSGGEYTRFGGNIVRFSGSDGVGASNKANGSSGSPSVSLTTTQDNSAIVAICGDWNAVSGTQTFTLGGSSSGWVALTDYPGDSARYGVAIAYHPNAGSAGSKTIAMSAPTGQKWAIVVVEVKGTAGAGASAVPVMMRQYRARR